MKSCGIDFGTSNSALALVTGEGVKLSAVEGENLTIPSAIFYDNEGHVIYGRDAISSFTEGNEGRLMRGFKRALGTYLIEYGAIINGRLKAYDRIIAGFLHFLKTHSEAGLGVTLDSVVMGRPVCFVDNNKEADKLAQDQLESIAKLIGFKNIEF